MRLDKFLKVSRLIKRRTIANEACDAGRVLVNEKVAKASLNIKEGDIIEIQFGIRTVKVEVLNVQETVKKEEANILKPMKRKATEYILKALTVKFISSASYPTNIEDIKPEPSSEAIVTITEKMPVSMRLFSNNPLSSAVFSEP